jgi:tetratricopeptide (TPR) repeat protein
MPLEAVLATFIQPHRRGEQQFVGHVEQMQASRCFAESDGRLGCISCHDPHRQPDADARFAYFNARCLRCHQPPDCSEDELARRQTQRPGAPADNCVECHMPATGSEVQHASTTDHRIPRRSVLTEENVSPPSSSSPLPIVAWHQRDWEKASPEDRRDLAVALVMLIDIKASLIGPQQLTLAERWLREAVAAHPDDLPAREALGHALWRQGQPREANVSFDEVLKIAPDREFSLSSAAALAQATGNSARAAYLWRRAAELNPQHLRYHLESALARAHLRQWPECEAAARRTLDLQPFNPGGRQLLVESLLGQTRFEDADREFDQMPVIHAAKANALKKWYEQHPLNKARVGKP